MADSLGGDVLGRRQLAEAAFGAMAAQQLSDAFFGMCMEVANLDESEMAVLRSLRKSVRNAIETRNDLQHGDWMMGLYTSADPSTATTSIHRFKPGRAAGSRVSRSWTAAELDDEAHRLARLKNEVAEFGMLALRRVFYDGIEDDEGPPFRVRDVLRVEGGVVVRDGPRASKLFTVA